MIKAVIFDADGMLLNQERFSVFLARDYGITLETTNSFFNGPFQECLVGKADLREVIAPLLHLWGWDKGVDAFLGLWFTRENNINRELIKFIQDWREGGMLCFLATNQEKYRLGYILHHLAVEKVFDRIYPSAHLGYKKPTQEFFTKIMEDLGNIKKEEVLFWDDKPENVKKAKDFGFEAELYTTFLDFKEKMKEYTI